MKKLLLIIFSILISFNSQAGSLDGKGLKCEWFTGQGYAKKDIYIWFEDGLFELPRIEGSRISWLRFQYEEDGTQYIRFDKDKWRFAMEQFAYPLNFLMKAQVNRASLILSPLVSFPHSTRYRCSVLRYKQWIVSDLQKEINASSSTNKI